MRTPILLLGAALAVRLVLIAAFPDPAYPDSFYYVNVARALAAGDGLRVDFIWIFADVGGTIPTNPILPIPSNAHWMPLASLVQVPFIWMLGPTAWASALPFAIIGAVAAPLTWAVARDAGSRPLVAVSAGLLVATPVLSTPFMVQPDNFSLFQPLVVGALWLGAHGLRGSGRAFVAAGALGGLATLARNDGLLVLVALGLAVLWDRARARRLRDSPAGGGPRIGGPRIDGRAALGAVAAFGLVMIPWWVRQLTTFGSLSPSTASGKVLFIRSIEEWNSIATPASLDRLLAMGAGPLMATRMAGLTAAIAIFAQVIAGLILVPFLLVGGWARRRSSDFGVFFLYGALLFAFSALISAVHVPGGTFLHSAVALVPHSFILVVEGIVLVVDKVVARRPALRPEQTRRLFVGAAVAFAGVMAVAGSVIVHSGWSAQRDDRQAVSAALDGAGVPMTDRVMSIDAAGYRYWTGRGGVVLVNDPIDTIRRVAAAYDIRWLVLNRGDGVAAVESILNTRARPDWVGAPLFTIPDSGGLADRIGVYPVCFTAGDARCAR